MRSANVWDMTQEVIARSGDISALNWVGQSSEFNSCLPANITSYKAPPYTPPSLSEDEIQTLVSLLQNDEVLESASKLYTFLDHMSAPRFANCRLHLPCIVFPITELTWRPIEHMETCFTYKVKADQLRDLKITTKRKLSMFSQGRPVGSSPFLIVRPWDRRLFEVPDYADNTESVGDDDFSLLLESPGEQGLIDSELSDHAMRLIVRLGQPFHAFLLAK
jgi:hypothetical protein